MSYLIDKKALKQIVERQGKKFVDWNKLSDRKKCKYLGDSKVFVYYDMKLHLAKPSAVSLLPTYIKNRLWWVK